MRENPFHPFLLFMTGQIPDHVTLGDLRWFTVALYWLLFLGGLGIAAIAWRRDPRQGSAHHLGVFALRFTAAGMWHLRTLWKLPLPVSDGFRFWLGKSVKYSSFQLHADVVQIVMDHIAIAQPLVYLMQVFLTASLMLGFAVRLAGVIGAVFTLNLMISLYKDPGDWPWTYVGIICADGMFAVCHAGRSLGLNALLRDRPVAGLAVRTPAGRLHAVVS